VRALAPGRARFVVLDRARWHLGAANGTQVQHAACGPAA
jgi:hypothetical protein